MERFCAVRQSHLDRELEFIEFMRFQRGLAASERAMIDDRAAAVTELAEATAGVERQRQKLQLTRASAVEGSIKVAAATDQMRQAEIKRKHAGMRLDSISGWYHDEAKWCDAERVRDMKASLLEFVQLQREQAESAAAAVSLRALLDVVKPTDAELKSSQDRIQQRFGGWPTRDSRQPSPASSTPSRPSNDFSVGRSSDAEPHAAWLVEDGEEDEFNFLGHHVDEEAGFM